MKYIVKSVVEPDLFVSWKTSNPNATYNDLSDPNDANARAAKQALKDALLKEQKYLCCYCECRIDDSTSHIEHFKPKAQDKFPDLQLEYSNLHASCTKRPTGKPDEHCGHKKADVYSKDLVSPLEYDCSTHFQYMLNGTIVGTDDRGKATIATLNLNSALLDIQRKTLIDYFSDFDDKDLESEITSHLDSTKSEYGEFYSMIECLHEQHLL